MRARRLPGSRNTDPTPPGEIPPAKAPPPPPPRLFDGDLPRRNVVRTDTVAIKLETPRMAFGARSLIVTAILTQMGLALLLAPRLIRVLDNLSNNPRSIIPLAGIGAVAVVLAGWGWFGRGWGVAIAFCVAGGAWWLYFFAQSF